MIKFIVFDPFAVPGPDGILYFFSRLIAKGNYSRIGIARVRFNKAGDPTGVDRLGIALEPEEDYEMWPDGRGGCEDPRITYVERFKRYVMTYTAHSPIGPRIPLVIWDVLFHRKRLGLVTFEPFRDLDFVHVDNKNNSLFPVAIPNQAGKMQPAIIHRPLFSVLFTRRRHVIQNPVWWISIMKVSGSLTVLWTGMGTNRINLACLTPITG